MENSGNQIRKGFILGIGLVLPVAAAVYLGGVASYLGSSFFIKDGSTYGMGEEWQKDFTGDIIVESFRESKLGNQVIILGSIINKGEKPLSSIQLEAEFFGASGEFVYETSEYVRTKLKPNERENFQITCGCKDQPFPEYKSVKVKVASVSSY